MEPLLEVEDLHVSYNGVGAVNGVSLSMQRGGITTVIGANGAGKSTLVNAVVGLLPAQGRLKFDGIDMVRQPCERRVERGDRTRVVKRKDVTVRDEMGGRRINKKTK